VSIAFLLRRIDTGGGNPNPRVLHKVFKTREMADAAALRMTDGWYLYTVIPVVEEVNAVQVVLSYHHYEKGTLVTGSRERHVHATVAIRREGAEIVVWNHRSSNGPYGFASIIPAAREFAQELSEVLDAPITEIQQ